MLNIALIHPDIPQNTGNVGRLCVGLKATLHLVKPMGFVLEDKKIRRSGLDYWQDLDLVIHKSLTDFLQEFQNSRRFFLSTKGQKNYTGVSYQKGDVLIFGSETKGLPKSLLEKNQENVLTIPMLGPIRSLNLATSVGIVAYEALRQILGSS